MLRKALWASALLILGGANADHHLPSSELSTPRSNLATDLLFSDIAYRAAYCSAAIETNRPSASGGHLPDFFAWPGYPKAMIKWKYTLWRLDSASKAPSADSARMQEARGLAEADIAEIASVESEHSAFLTADARMRSAACDDSLSWLP